MSLISFPTKLEIVNIPIPCYTLKGSADTAMYVVQFISLFISLCLTSENKQIQGRQLIAYPITH